MTNILIPVMYNIKKYPEITLKLNLNTVKYFVETWQNQSAEITIYEYATLHVGV